MEKRSWTKRIFALMLAVITAITSWSIDWGINTIVTDAGEKTLAMSAGDVIIQQFTAAGYSQISGSNISIDVREVTADAQIQAFVYTNTSLSGADPRANSNYTVYSDPVDVTTASAITLGGSTNTTLMSNEKYFVSLWVKSGSVVLESYDDSGVHFVPNSNSDREGSFIAASPSAASNTETVTFTKTKYVLNRGDSTALEMESVAPGRTVKYQSSDVSIASVDSKTGKITANAEGSCTIKAWIDDSTASPATCEVVVLDVSVSKLPYNGTPQTPTEIITSVEVKNPDYFAITGEATDVGDTVTVTGYGKYAGYSKEVSAISKLDISGCTQVNAAPFTISGDTASADTLFLKIKNASVDPVVLTSSDDFTTEIVSSPMSGSNKTYNVKVTAKDTSKNYTGSVILNQTEAVADDTESIKSVVSSISVDNVTYNAEDQTSAIIESIAFNYVGGNPGLENNINYTVKITDANGTDKTGNVKNEGLYVLYVIGKGPYKSSESVSTTFRVTKRNISDTVTGEGNYEYALSATKYTYSNGTVYKPTLTAKYKSENITGEVTYSHNDSVGTASVTITGNGNYTGSHTETFFIAGNLSGAKINVLYDGTNKTKIPHGGDTGLDIEYTGSEITGITVLAVYVPGMGDSDVLLDEDDYTVNIDTGKSVGEKKRITISGKAGGNYDGGSAYVTFDVVPKDISDSARLILESESNVYDALSHKPTGTIKYNNDTLPASDYTVTYSYTDSTGKSYADGFTNVSSEGVAYTVTASLSGNYTGTISAAYAITPLSISSPGVSVVYDNENGPVYYNGTARTVNINYVKVYFGETNEVPAANYSIDSNGYSNNTMPGTATATINGTGNLTGSRTFEFEIVAGHEALHFKVNGKEYGSAVASSSPAYLPGAGEYENNLYSVTYTGSAYDEPVVEVYSDSEQLEYLDDYTVSFSGVELTNVGETYIKVTGQGGYAGIEAYLRVQIKRKSIKDSDITAENKKNTDGYVLKKDGVELIKDTDYEVLYTGITDPSYSSNAYPSASGKYKATITGINNYCETRVEDIEIGHSIEDQCVTIYKLKIQEQVKSNGDIEVVGIEDEVALSYNYDGNHSFGYSKQIPYYGDGVKPMVYVSEDSSVDTTLIDKSKYYDVNIVVGSDKKATLTITGKDDYYGEIKTDYTVVDMKMTEAIDAEYKGSDAESSLLSVSIDNGSGAVDETGNKVSYVFGTEYTSVPKLIYNPKVFNTFKYNSQKHKVIDETGYHKTTYTFDNNDYTLDPQTVGMELTLDSNKKLAAKVANITFVPGKGLSGECAKLYYVGQTSIDKIGFSCDGYDTKPNYKAIKDNYSYKLFGNDPTTGVWGMADATDEADGVMSYTGDRVTPFDGKVSLKIGETPLEIAGVSYKAKGNTGEYTEAVTTPNAAGYTEAVTTPKAAGWYQATITLKDSQRAYFSDYTNTAITVEYYIMPKVLTNSMIATSQYIFEYKNGEYNITTDGGLSVTGGSKGTDYDVTGDETGTAPGKYTAVVEGKNNFRGSQTLDWYIQIDISKSPYIVFKHGSNEISDSNTSLTTVYVDEKGNPCFGQYSDPYAPSNIRICYKSTGGEIANIHYGTDYSVSSSAPTPTAPGETVIVPVSGSGNIVTGTANLYFKPVGYFSNSTIEVRGLQSYYEYKNGAQVEPKDGYLYYKHSGKKVNPNEYVISYGTNTGVGDGTITFTLKNENNYEDYGPVTATFKIKVNLASAEIILSGDKFNKTDSEGNIARDYDTTGDLPTVVVKVPTSATTGSSIGLTERIDYNIEFPTGENAKNQGKKTIKLTATDTGNCFSNSPVMVNYRINKLSIEDESITIDNSGIDYGYTGSEIQPGVNPFTCKGIPLTKDVDYTVKWKDNVNVSRGNNKAKVIVEGINNFEGSKTLTFTILARELSSNVEIRQKDILTYTGGDLRTKAESVFGLFDSGMGDYELVADKDYKLQEIRSVSDDGSKNKWQVGDRIEVDVTGTVGDGTNYRSSKLTYTLTDVIKPANLSDGTFTKNGTEKEYTGNVIDPDFNITLAGATTALKKGTDYTVTYNDGTNMVDAGAYKVTVTAKDNPNVNSQNNIEGYNTFDFNVNKKELDYADASKSWPGDGDEKDTDDDVLDKYVIAAIPDMPYNAGNYVTPSVDIYDVSADAAGGSQQTIDGVAYAKAKKLTENVDYRLSYENNTAGTDAAIVYISAMDSGNYSSKNPIKKTFAIGKSIAGAQVTVKPAYTYNGSEQKPAADSEITVVLDGKELTYGTDGYNVLFEGSDYTSAGTKQITITGVGGYYGNVTAEYTIEPKTVEAIDTDGDASNNVECTLDLNSTKTIGNKTYKSMLFDGKTCEPNVIVKDVATGAILVKDKDYELTYAGNTARTKNLSDLATVYVTIKNDGNYRGRISPVWSEKFYIDGVDIAGLAMSGIDGNAYEWSGGDQGERIKQDIVITNGSRGTQLTEGTDYTVTFSTSPVSVGKYTLTIRGIGNYSGTRTATVYIFADLSNDSYTTASAATQHYSGSTVNPVITVTCAGKQLVQGTGVNTQDADFYVSSCTPLDTHDWATATKGVATISGIDKNLYVLDRTIEFNVDFSADGFVVTDDSDGSRTGSQIKGYTLSNQYIYTGSEIKPEFRLWDGNTEITNDSSRNTYYDENEVVYRSDDDGTDCINVGTVTISIPIYTNVNGKKKSTKKEISYKIVPRAISSCQIDEIDLETYTGAAITPKLKVTYGNTELKEGSGSNGDYSVTFSNNITPGRASVKVKGNGNYTGTVTEYFTIKPASVTTVNASTKTKTKIDVSWTPVSNVDGYQIIYKQGRTQKQVDVGSGQSAATLASLSQATDYTVQVRSYVLVGATKYYGTAGQTSAATKPATPVIKVTSPATGQIKISWNKNTAATGYVVYRSTTKDGAYSRVKTISGSNKTAYINKKRTSGQKYYYYVRAYAVKNGKTVYSAASTKKGIRAK